MKDEENGRDICVGVFFTVEVTPPDNEAKRITLKLAISFSRLRSRTVWVSLPFTPWWMGVKTPFCSPRDLRRSLFADVAKHLDAQTTHDMSDNSFHPITSGRDLVTFGTDS